MISEDGKIDVVVEYYQEARDIVNQLGNPYLSITEQKRRIRKLQRYTVGISETMKRTLANAVYPAGNGTLLVLSRDYYSTEIGVTNAPEHMEMMSF